MAAPHRYRIASWAVTLTRASAMTSPFGSILDIKLIKIVQVNPILYDSKVEGYLESNKRDLIWHQIGEELGMPAQLCKNRWITIRDNMRRKVKDRERKMPTSRRLHSKNKYKYEDELRFIMPFFKIKQHEDEETYKESIEDFVDDDPFIEEEEVYLELSEEKPDAASLLGFNKDQGSSSVAEKCHISMSSSTPERADPINVFLDAVALTLRNLNPYYLNQAKSKIFQVVQDCELQQIVNKGEHPPPV